MELPDRHHVDGFNRRVEKGSELIMGENRFDKFVEWIFSKAPYELSEIDAADKFHKTMRTAAKCCYIASIRLQRQARLSLLIAGFLIVGLILIPLIQNTNLQIAFPPNILNMAQIVMAIAVLVYLVIIAKARYEVRARQFSECEIKIKALIQEFNKVRAASFETLTAETLDGFQRRYFAILSEVETHEPNDYRLATLEMFRDYFITGLPRLKLYSSAQLIRASALIIPIIIIVLEILFVTEMLGFTKIVTPYMTNPMIDSRLSHGLSEVPKDLK